MELVYMWIKKYGHMKNIGLNFGGEDFFLVKKKKKKENNEYEIEITKKDNPHHIKNFFNIYKEKDKNKEKVNIINVTAIIGENGAGKSAILEIIQKIGPKVQDAFFILKNGDEYIRTELMDKYKFTGLYPKHSVVKLQNVIFYDNVLQTSNFKRYYRENDNIFFNLSTMKYLYEDKYKTKPLETALSEYSLEELNRQMDFVSNFYKIIKDDFEFEIPSVITILDTHPNQNKEDEMDKEKAEHLFDDINSNEVKKFFKKMDFSNYIYKTFKTNNFPSNLHKIMKSIFLQWLLNTLNSKEAKIKELVKTIIKYSGSPEKFYTFLQSLKKIQLDNLLEIFDVLVKIAYNYQKYKKPLTNTITENIFGNFKKDNDNISKLVRLLKKTDYTSNLLQFKWRDMSSGEVAILTLFSRFHSIKHKIQSDNILILLDEPDMYLHPRWVQKFINVFIEYLNVDFSGKTIQIILTSNKPICSSDLPTHNVIKLKKTGYDENNWPIIKVIKDDGYQSFGANIYSLYKDGFFLNEGFIGMFAKKKIQAVIKWLNNNRIRKPSKKHENTIMNIGDPIIKHKLNQMYYDKMEIIQSKDRSDDQNQ